MAVNNQTISNEQGKYYTFRTQLSNGECFAVTPTYKLPHNAQPVVDDQTGVCIGYSVAHGPGLWRIYDAEGRFATLEESPLETPFIDPLDIVLFTFGAFRLLRTGRALLETAASSRMSIALSEASLNILKGRFKFGLSAIRLKFTRTTAARMADPGRYIPIQILEKAIRFGSRRPDVQEVAGQFEYRIGMSRLSKRIEGTRIVYYHKDYILHVVVNERDWTVVHIHIN